MLTGSAILIYWIVVAVVAVVFSILHMGIVMREFTMDLDDFFESYAWVTFLACATIGATVFGFLNWLWWATLLILLAIVPIEIVIVIAVYKWRKKEEVEDPEYASEETEEQTSYSCPNCGAKIFKTTIIDSYGKKEIKYTCKHCNSVIEKNQMFSIANPEEEIETFDLDDWEEEYFDACEALDFKPHNHHSEKQIDRRVESIQEKIDDGEDVYETDDYDQEDILNSAYDFFIDNLDEIEEYLEQHSKEEIQKHFNYYCRMQEFENSK